MTPAGPNPSRTVCSLAHIKAPDPEVTPPPAFTGARYALGSISLELIERAMFVCSMAHPGGKISSNKPEALRAFLAKKKERGAL